MSEKVEAHYTGFHNRDYPKRMANQHLFKIFYKKDFWDKYSTRSRYVPASYFEEDGADYIFYMEEFGSSKDNYPQIDTYIIHRVPIDDVSQVGFGRGEIDPKPIEDNIRKSLWQKIFFK